MKRPLFALFLLIAAGCGHLAPVPCTDPHPRASPCEPVKCNDGEPGCSCDGKECWKVTCRPAPVPPDAQVSR